MRSVCGELPCEGENRGLVFRVSRVVRFSFFFGWAFQVWNALRRREVLHESRIVGQVSTFFFHPKVLFCAAAVICSSSVPSKGHVVLGRSKFSGEGYEIVKDDGMVDSSFRFGCMAK